MILTIGPGGCGFTFLSWSIAFLRGDIFYKTSDGQVIPVDINPIIGQIAHKFHADHLIVDNTDFKLNSVTDQSIFYLVPFNNHCFEHILTLPGKKIIFDNRSHQLEWFVRAYTCMPNNPYAELINKLSLTYSVDSVKQVLHDSVKFFIEYYQIPNDQYTLNYRDIFFNLDYKILEILDFVNINIDQGRFSQWKLIYDQYRLSNAELSHLLRLPNSTVNSTTKLKILKEIIEWKNGLFHTA